MSAAAPPIDYLTGFLLLGLPILLFMLALGVIAIRKRWKYVAIICGGVFLLTAGRTLLDARQRQLPKEVMIVRGIGLGSGLTGLLLIILGLRIRLKPDGIP